MRFECDDSERIDERMLLVRIARRARMLIASTAVKDFPDRTLSAQRAQLDAACGEWVKRRNGVIVDMETPARAT